MKDEKISIEKRIEAAKRIVSAEEKPVDWEEIKKVINQVHKCEGCSND